MAVIDNLALSKNALRVHHKIGLMPKSWKTIDESDKVFKKLKNRLHFDKDNYKEARNELQKLILPRKKLTLKVSGLRTLGSMKNYVTV